MRPVHAQNADAAAAEQIGLAVGPEEPVARQRRDGAAVRLLQSVDERGRRVREAPAEVAAHRRREARVLQFLGGARREGAHAPRRRFFFRRLSLQASAFARSSLVVGPGQRVARDRGVVHHDARE